MNEVVIRVRGQHEERRTPEEATVHVQVVAEAVDAAAAVAAVTDGVTALRGLSGEPSEEGPVSQLSVDQVFTSARPFGQRPDDGSPRALEHTARVTMTVRYRDVAALGTFVFGAGEVPGAEVGWIAWDVTAQTRAEVQRESRGRAVADAASRAADYAASLGLTHLRPRALADSGMLGEPQTVALRSRATFDTGGGTPVLDPEDVLLSAEVEAEFVAFAAAPDQASEQAPDQAPADAGTGAPAAGPTGPAAPTTSDPAP